MNCDCVFCKLNHQFEAPHDLINELIAGKVVIFAGAGISTESKRVLPFTLYDDVASELDLEKSELSFPDLMEMMVSQTNGRLKLIQKIKKRLDHIDSFPELNQTASSFHRELGTLHLVHDVVTTNWDTYFERYCKATPFFMDSDLALWDAAERRVLKIHGSISNFGSIVATKKDYAKCKTRLFKGVIGGLLKTILATKTVVFIGYSLADSDFQALYSFVKTQMQKFHRQAYVVNPYKEECERLSAFGLIPINTDGTYFISQIKEHAVNLNILLPDKIFRWASHLRDIVAEEHHKLHKRVKVSRIPELIFAASYQDGLAHALDRAITMQGSGEYSHRCRVVRLIELYEEMKKDKLKAKLYSDVAYIEGYINGLLFLVVSAKSEVPVIPPFLFAFGVSDEVRSVSGFLKLFSNNRIPHLAARKAALKMLQKISNPAKIEFHHPPWL